MMCLGVLFAISSRRFSFSSSLESLMSSVGSGAVPSSSPSSRWKFFLLFLESFLPFVLRRRLPNFAFLLFRPDKSCTVLFWVKELDAFSDRSVKALALPVLVSSSSNSPLSACAEVFWWRLPSARGGGTVPGPACNRRSPFALLELGGGGTFSLKVNVTAEAASELSSSSSLPDRAGGLVDAGNVQLKLKVTSEPASLSPASGGGSGGGPTGGARATGSMLPGLRLGSRHDPPGLQLSPALRRSHRFCPLEAGSRKSTRISSPTLWMRARMAMWPS